MDDNSILNSVTPDPDNEPAKVNKSKLFIRSIGRAAHNIDAHNPVLEIIPIEELGYVSGEINTERESLQASGSDNEGNVFNIDIETSNVIMAEWMPLNTNRLSVPNIRRGERVLIWQYGDHDKYYWTPTGFDDNIRRLETAIFRFSNTQDESDKTITPENSYWFEVSTHKKHITLSTSTSDGEAHAYVVQINTGDSRLTIRDDQDNFIEIDTPARRLSLVNVDNTHVIMTGKDMNIHADNNINLTCKTFNVTTETNNIKTKTHNITCDVSNLNASKYNIKANVASNGKFTNNGVNISSTHKHGAVSSGPSSTSTPI